jgi:NADH-quinone oxidoreductase subunit N
MFLAAVQAGLYTLAVIGVVTSVIGAYYYLRIVKTIYFDEPAGDFDRMDSEVKLVAYASGTFILLFVFFANPLIDLAAQAAQSLY